MHFILQVRTSALLAMLRVYIIVLTSICCYVSVVFSLGDELKDILHEEIPESCKEKQKIEDNVKETTKCFGNDLRKAMPFDLQDRIDEEVAEFCLIDMTRCLKHMGISVEHCLSEEKYQEIIQDPINAFAGGQSYACSDNGQPLKDFIRSTPHCLAIRNVSRALTTECGEESEKLEKQWFSHSFDSEEECREVFEWVDCLINAFDHCDDTTTSDFIKHLSRSMLIETPCREYIQVLEELLFPSNDSDSASLPVNNLFFALFTILLVMLNAHFCF